MKRIDFICEYCGKTHNQLLQNYVKKEHHYCGVGCAHRARHKDKVYINVGEEIDKYCKCGCGNKITPRQYDNRLVYSDYISGHNSFGRKLPEESKKRLSDFHKGKPKSEETKRKLSEIHKKMVAEDPSNNPNWKGGISKVTFNCDECGKETIGRKCNYDISNKHFCSMNCKTTHEARLKTGTISPNTIVSKCDQCGKEINIRKFKQERSKYHFCSRECDNLHRKESGRLCNENNPSWKGGLSFEPYSRHWKESLKLKIRERDGFKCAMCNKSQEDEGSALSVHHIDYDKLNCNEDNLISLCNSCHVSTNHNREKWLQFFNDLKENKIWQA